MDFFNSLTLDLKMLVVAIAGCALLALFSGNQKAEKRYMLVFAVLAAVGTEAIVGIYLYGSAVHGGLRPDRAWPVDYCHLAGPETRPGR